jgi:hypothetical protein
MEIIAKKLLLHLNAAQCEYFVGTKYHIPDSKFGYFVGHDNNVRETMNEIGYHASLANRCSVEA